MYSFITNLALYLPIDPFALYFPINIHLLYKAFWSLGLLTISYVEFLSNASIFSLMAWVHKASWTKIGIYVASMPTIKLWCLLKILPMLTYWEIGYLTHEIFPFLHAMGKFSVTVTSSTLLWGFLTFKSNKTQSQSELSLIFFAKECLLSHYELVQSYLFWLLLVLEHPKKIDIVMIGRRALSLQVLKRSVDKKSSISEKVTLMVIKIWQIRMIRCVPFCIRMITNNYIFKISRI